MTLDRMVLAFAGCMVVLTTALGVLASPWWLAFTAFVGLNLLQSAFTGFCPLALVLKRIGVRPGAAFG